MFDLERRNSTGIELVDVVAKAELAVTVVAPSVHLGTRGSLVQLTLTQQK